MTPPIHVRSASPYISGMAPIPLTGSAVRCINIRVVRVRRGIISGDLEPYAESGTETVVSTSFRGRVDGNRISGTFMMASPLREKPLEGTWIVARQIDSP